MGICLTTKFYLVTGFISRRLSFGNDWLLSFIPFFLSFLVLVSWSPSVLSECKGVSS